MSSTMWDTPEGERLANALARMLASHWRRMQEEARSAGTPGSKQPTATTGYDLKSRPRAHSTPRPAA